VGAGLTCDKGGSIGGRSAPVPGGVGPRPAAARWRRARSGRHTR
jgi:hypothetical protein